MLQPQKWCFESSELVMTNPPVIKTPGKADEHFDEFWPEHLINATISYSDEINVAATIPVILYGDRVFWPCDKSE